MRIGELARTTGVEVDTIRYYERAGLLSAPKRSDNGYRTYAPGDLARLAFIRHCRALDIPLADIQRLLSIVDSPESDCGEINHLVDLNLARVRARLASMQALEQQLMALRGQCATPDKASACGILHELVAAAQGEACACHRPADTGATSDGARP
ncbi:MAG: Zn(II)-responsive regulator of zntA [Candidatus Accumulibacter adjunctus]|uniref:Zn(II)-responsive regulator of zntA n=1 Tax=Candidatus Accumulibacter adjunctus TaxID=1454001 RepID=A0A011NRN4_9PROT|nr:MAG: Zn(II)-responsive regulator of zntA [Candidatus Accumulibacter adjunctus]